MGGFGSVGNVREIRRRAEFCLFIPYFHFNCKRFMITIRESLPLLVPSRKFAHACQTTRSSDNL